MCCWKLGLLQYFVADGCFLYVLNKRERKEKIEKRESEEDGDRDRVIVCSSN
jgi:hypothetical protein